MRGLPRVNLYPRFDLKTDAEGNISYEVDPEHSDGKASPFAIEVMIGPPDGSFSAFRGQAFLAHDGNGLVDGYAFARALIRLGNGLFAALEAHEQPEEEPAINLTGVLPAGNA